MTLSLSTRQYFSLGVFIIGQLVVRHSIAQVASECRICGENGPENAPFLDRVLPSLGVPAETCGDLVNAVLFVEAGTEICNSIQAFGTFCGCNLPPDPCHLCWDGSRVPNENLTLPTYQVSMFTNTFGFDSSPNCQALEALLHTTRTGDTQPCLDIQVDVGETCGCPPLPVESLPPNNSTNSTTQDANNDTTLVEPPPEDEEIQPCNICENGVSSPVPDKLVNVGRGPQITCSEWEILASSFPEGSADCLVTRSATSTICQCPRREGQCTMCPLGELIPKPQQRLNWYTDSFLSAGRQTIFSEDRFLTCELMESNVASEHPLLDEIFGTQQELLCTAMQMKSWICGCRPDWRQIVLTWSYRLSAMLSFVGSSLIIVFILRKPNRRFTTYHQLVLGISTFDIISSIAYMLVGVMAPYEAGFYLSRGNQTTCKMQGFMIQLGQTASMFYNLCLSLYFFMVIMLSWREKFLRKILVGAHFCVIATGLGMSVGALPYIEAQFGVCGILPPLTASQWQVSLFYTVPVSVVLIVLTAVTVSICWHVYAQHVKVRKWRADKQASVTKIVFWQSFWYVSAFYLTLPFVLLSFYVKFESPRYFWIYIATAILAPLQGMMNALVYFQRSKDFRALLSRLRRWIADFPANCSRTREASSHSTDDAPAFTSVGTERTGVASVGRSSAEVADDKREDHVEDTTTTEHVVETNNVLVNDDEAPTSAESSQHKEQPVCTNSDEVSMELNVLVSPPESPPDPGWGSRLALWNIFGRTMNDGLAEDLSEDEGGVLEYWKLHEEEFLPTASMPPSGSNTSVRFGESADND